MDKYLLVGIGNPGKKYAYTRHNIGFYIVDIFAKLYNVDFKEEPNGLVGTFKTNDSIVYVLKSTTFVNNSGVAVNYYIHYLKIDLKNILVIVDDINLEFGQIRFREKGSSGGHNGLKSIEHYIGPEYARIRYGVGHEFIYGQQSDYVLRQFTPDELKKVNASIPAVISKIQEIIKLQTLQNI